MTNLSDDGAVSLTRADFIHELNHATTRSIFSDDPTTRDEFGFIDTDGDKLISKAELTSSTLMAGTT
jgi:hypothetical protein